MTDNRRQQLLTAIRGWSQMDRQTDALMRQMLDARAARDRHEATALTLMQELGMQGSKFQTGDGGLIKMETRRCKGDLSWSYLEREVAAWARSTGLQPTGLLQWLQDHRGTQETPCLKRMGIKRGSRKSTNGDPGLL